MLECWNNTCWPDFTQSWWCLQCRLYIYNKLRLFCPRPEEAAITLLVVDCGWCRIDIYLVSPYYLLSQTHTEHNQCSSLDRELLTNTNFQLLVNITSHITLLVTLSRCHTCHDSWRVWQSVTSLGPAKKGASGWPPASTPWPCSASSPWPRQSSSSARSRRRLCSYDRQTISRRRPSSGL